MIEILRIEDLAIVERAELEFGPGLNVLTGETGAGKSIVLGALGLLVGARASAEAVREGAEEGAVEAIFNTECHPDVEAELEARGLGPEDHELVVRRSVSRKSRGRTRVGGQLAPVATLTELFAGRVEISSQHSSQALLQLETHGLLLDAAGALEPLRAEVESRYAELRETDAEIAALREAADDRVRRQDFLAFQLHEIDDAALEPGELVGLERDHGRLAHAERIRAEGGEALAALVGEPSGADSLAAADHVSRASKRIDGLTELDPTLGEVADRLRTLDTELRDVARDLERHLDGVEHSPARLGEVEERLAQIERLRRKYGRDIEEILATRDRLAQELGAITGADEREAALRASRDSQHSELAGGAGRLAKARAKAARKLSKEVTGGLAELAMPAARFEVALDPVSPPDGFPCGPHGSEVPEFRFAGNRGESLRSLRKVASGGELSRVFLAIKNALRTTGLGMVLVFDEVDAGIGGRTAERVGRALAQLAAHHQVLCITHLPQIAAFAEVHFRVSKHERAGRTRTQVTRVEGDARIEEIARMAGGERVTEATRQHAEELLRSTLEA